MKRSGPAPSTPPPAGNTAVSQRATIGKASAGHPEPRTSWQPTLSSPRLLLRPLTENDWTELHAIASDPAIWAGHPDPDRWRLPEFRNFFDKVMGKRGAMAVIDRKSGALVGTSTFHNHCPERSQVEIGNTFLVRSHWGEGHNAEMKRVMLEHAFRQVDTVVFRIGETNARSRRACEKIGGRLTDRVELIEGPRGPMPHLVYAIDRTDFIAGLGR